MTCHFLRLSRSLIENPTFQQILPTIILRYSRLPSRSRTGLVMLLDLFLVRFSLIFLSVPCDGLSWLHTLNTQYRIDRIVTHSSHCGGAQTSPELRTQLVTDWLPSWHVMTIRGVARGAGGWGPRPPLESKDKKISVSCRSTEYGCDVVYIRKRLNIFVFIPSGAGAEGRRGVMMSRQPSLTCRSRSSCLSSNHCQQLVMVSNFPTLLSTVYIYYVAHYRVAISCNGADVCLSVRLSVTCHISKTEPDRAIVTMDHYTEVGCN